MKKKSVFIKKNALSSVFVKYFLRICYILLRDWGSNLHKTNFFFQITTSMMDPPGLKNQTLMLVDRESEKNKWVDALTELHRILRRNKLPSRTVSIFSICSFILFITITNFYFCYSDHSNNNNCLSTQKYLKKKLFMKQ